MGALIAFPSATIDPSDAWQTKLALIDLEGLVFHHAPSVSPASRALTSHWLRRILWEITNSVNIEANNAATNCWNHKGCVWQPMEQTKPPGKATWLSSLPLYLFFNNVQGVSASFGTLSESLTLPALTINKATNHGGVARHIILQKKKKVLIFLSSLSDVVLVNMVGKTSLCYVWITRVMSNPHQWACCWFSIKTL